MKTLPVKLYKSPNNMINRAYRNHRTDRNKFLLCSGVNLTAALMFAAVSNMVCTLIMSAATFVMLKQSNDSHQNMGEFEQEYKEFVKRAKSIKNSKKLNLSC